MSAREVFKDDPRADHQDAQKKAMTARQNSYDTPSVTRQ